MRLVLLCVVLVAAAGHLVAADRPDCQASFLVDRELQNLYGRVWLGFDTVLQNAKLQGQTFAQVAAAATSLVLPYVSDDVKFLVYTTQHADAPPNPPAINVTGAANLANAIAFASTQGGNWGEHHISNPPIIDCIDSNTYEMTVMDLSLVNGFHLVNGNLEFGAWAVQGKKVQTAARDGPGQPFKFTSMILRITDSSVTSPTGDRGLVL